MSFLLCCLPSLSALAAPPMDAEVSANKQFYAMDVRTLAKAKRIYDEGILKAKLSAALMAVNAQTAGNPAEKSAGSPAPEMPAQRREAVPNKARLVSVFGTPDALVAEARLPSGHVKSLSVNDVLDDDVVTQITAHGVMLKRKNTTLRFLPVGGRF
jgi:type IV pilus biogenesis protein PilP